ncbi:MAG: DUF167 family protein [Candidatus Margulisiibacteriota bacterium]
MKLNVKVIPNAKQNKIKEENGITKVYLTAPPVDGKANIGLVDFLAAHFKIKKSQIKIVRGEKSRNKTVEIFAMLMIGLSIFSAAAWGSQKIYPWQAQIGTKSYLLEVSDTSPARAKGLSDRKKIDRDKGMLFVYEVPGRYGFWMNKMFFPLDFVWVSGETVVDLTKNVPAPKNGKIESCAPKIRCDKIIEINAGEIDLCGVKVGDKVVFRELADQL